MNTIAVFRNGRPLVVEPDEIQKGDIAFLKGEPVVVHGVAYDDEADMFYVLTSPFDAWPETDFLSRHDK